MTTVNQVNSVRCVSNMGANLQFVSDSQDVQAIREHIGEIAADYDSFFVEVGDGDYTEVWGMVGIVPFKSKLVSQLL